MRLMMFFVFVDFGVISANIQETHGRHKEKKI
jgi:hypothetical protein